MIPKLRRHVLIALTIVFQALACCANASQEAAPAPDPCLTPLPAYRIYPRQFPQSFFQYIEAAATKYKSDDAHSVDLQKQLHAGFQCVWRELNAINVSIGNTSQLFGKHETAVDAQLQNTAAMLSDVSKSLTSLSSSTESAAITELKESRSLLARTTKIAAKLASVQKASQSLTNTISLNLAAASPLVPTGAAARNQMDPTTPILAHYPTSDIQATAAIVTVPDPRVPRHRRDYDNAITAVSQGMLRDGFVLDRYAFPWRKDLEPGLPVAVTAGAEETPPADRPAPDPHGSSQETIEEDSRYGLMIFRRDRWRDSRAPQAVELRAVYVVPETATYGVQEGALISAIEKLDQQMSPATPIIPKDGAQDKITPLVWLETAARAEHPYATVHGFTSSSVCLPADATGHRIEVIGPAYSGSMDSLREGLEAVQRGNTLKNVRSFCILSASTTSDTNRYVAREPESTATTVSYQSLATPDSVRLMKLDSWARALGIPVDHRRVVLLYEATTFGEETCPLEATAPYENSLVQDLCSSAIKIAFPANIADVRYGLQMQREAQEREMQTAKQREGVMSFDNSNRDTHLSLEEGAENGSEFPESEQSPLTTASSEAVLEQLMTTVRRFHPGLVIIVATDVRDRLFLMQMLNTIGSNALIVDLGADNLTAHRDFIYATRGMLALSTSPLTRIEVGLPNPYSPALAVHSDDCLTRQRTAAAVSVPESDWCARYEWATEQQALTFISVKTWAGGLDSYSGQKTGMPGEAYAPNISKQAPLFPHIVTRHGLLSIADVQPEGSMWWALAGLIVILVASVAHVAARMPVTTSMPSIRDFPELPGPWVAAALFVVLLGSGAGLMGSRELVAIPLVSLAGLIVGFARATVGEWQLTAWVSLLSLATIAVSALAGDSLITQPPDLVPLLNALGSSAGSGLAYGWVLVAAGFALVCTGTLAVNAARRHEATDDALSRTVVFAVQAGTGPVLGTAGRMLSIISWGMAAVGTTAAIYLFFRGEEQMTVFGRLADFTVFAALLAVTILEFLMLIGVEVAAARVMKLSRLVESTRSAARLFDATDPNAQPMLARNVGGAPLPKVATPALIGILGIPSWVAGMKNNQTAYGLSLQNALLGKLTSDGLGALYGAVADEMAVYRQGIAGVIACAVSAGVMVYFFPISEATPMIAFVAIVLLGCGVTSAYRVLQFEGDRILSNLACDRTERRQWSTGLVIVVLLPFVVLAGLVSLAQLPGVLDSEGGLIQLLVDHLPMIGK